MKLNKNLLSLIALGAATGVAPAVTVISNVSDAEATSTAGVGALGNGSILAGAYYGAGPGVVPVFAFQLPTLGAGETFSTATITLFLNGISGTPAFNGDIVGLTRTSASSAVIGADFAGAGTMLHDNFFTSASATGSSTSNDFTGWLNTQYAGGANAGNFVFIKVDAEGTAGVGSFQGYNVDSANNGTAANHPALDYTTVTVPEPSSTALLGLGGLALILRRRK